MTCLHDIIQYISTNIFIEIGTAFTDTIHKVINKTTCNYIFHVTTQECVYDHYKTTFTYEPRVTPKYISTTNELYDIIKDFGVSITFFIDGRNETDFKSICENIQKHHIHRHVIIVDHVNVYDDIVSTLLSINPNYEIKLFNNNKTLVAFVEPKICIQKYISDIKTSTQAPGFADVLRGTLSLFQFCQKYDYDLFIDATANPVFRYFHKNEHYIYHNVEGHVHEYISHTPYDIIDKGLTNLFKSGKSFLVFTNAFFRTRKHDKGFTNYMGGLADLEAKSFMHSILRPIPIIDTIINEIFDNIYRIPRLEPYCVIHIRTEDKFIHDESNIDLNICNKYLMKIKQIAQLTNMPIVLITDSKLMGRYWKENEPRVLYWENDKIHVGDRVGNGDIRDVVVDHCIIRGANRIYGNGWSGFSLSAATLYDIEYVNMQYI
jgi:hypothetical protein